MADVLVDFLNHGALPFVGRQIEQGRILRFWSDRGDERFALETLLLTGEAGIGKSRLIEETIPIIESRKGAVVHVKLRPEGSTSMIPLIALGIERSESARSLFPTLPSDKFSEAIGALRRLCALRRTLLVLEDVHLLGGPSLHEFSLLLEGLRDESLGVLAATRPVESAATDLLQAYVTDEIVLQGLEADAIEEMWHRLFKDRTSGAMSSMLRETTHGNALALRSALRGGVRVGALHRQGSEDTLEVQIEPWAFRESARRAARAVVTGMTAGLDADLLENACRLAQLGEVFSHEVAARTIANAEEVIAELTFRGILTRTTTSSMPINSTERRGVPVSFTHSLVHDDLLEEAPPSAEQLVHAIACGGPIYTYLPYRILQAHIGPFDVSGMELAAAAIACCRTARLVNATTDWRHAGIPLSTAETLVAALPDDFDPTERRLLTAEVLWTKLENCIRAEFDDDHKKLAERLLQLVGDDPEFHDYRLIALEHLIRNATELGRGDGRDLFDQAVAFADGCLRARASARYLQLLYVTVTAAHTRDDKEMLERIESIVNRLLEEDALDEEGRHNARIRLLPSFLALVHSGEQLLERKQQLEWLIPVCRPIGPDMIQSDLIPYFHIQSFYLAVGEIDRLVELSRRFVPVLQRHGLRQSYYLTRRWLLLGESLLGERNSRDLEPWRRLEEEIDGDGGLSDHEKERLRLSVARTYHNMGYLLGDVEAMEAALTEFNAALTDMAIANRMLHSLWHDDVEGFIGAASELPSHLVPLASIVVRPPENEADLVERHLEHMRELPWDLFQFIRLYITIEVLERAVAAGHIVELPAFRELGNRALTHCLEFLSERRLPALMTPIIARYGKYFSRTDRRAWEERIDALADARRQAGTPLVSEQVLISMFDTITVEVPGRERERLRGGRSTTLLGLLVANRMLKYPLERVDFFGLASGVENDPDRARTATNVAILRLREVIGRETIVTGSELPELNDRHAHIDVIEVWNALERGEKELHGGHLLNAREAARKAVGMAAGRVAFPGLYDELFERLREDLETRTRDLVMSVACRLVEAGDPREAEELLRAWNERVPGDEESLRLLAEALERSGERAEAVAVRARGVVVG